MVRRQPRHLRRLLRALLIFARAVSVCSAGQEYDGWDQEGDAAAPGFATGYLLTDAASKTDAKCLDGYKLFSTSLSLHVS